ncbi:MAG: hypothetical protein A4E29_01388 [Methanomassiliicoccales archaeon PtaB.Bin134]|nr:MAG: hypothetical protein A4E29_01388 [Methanomassiliicoccales archaeon PtaB.Bin134]
MPSSMAWILRSTWVVAAMVSPAVTKATLPFLAASMTTSSSSTSFRHRRTIFLPMADSRSSGVESMSLDV